MLFYALNENFCISTVCQNKYLNSRLRQVDLHGEVFSREHIGVMGLSKSCLQFLQLRNDNSMISMQTGNIRLEENANETNGMCEDINYLLQREGGPVPALLSPDESVVMDGRVVGVGRVCKEKHRAECV